MKLNLKTFFTTNRGKIDQIKSFLLTIIGYGILINYVLFITFHVPFKWFGFPAFGIIYYFVMEEFVEWFRKLRAKLY